MTDEILIKLLRGEHVGAEAPVREPLKMRDLVARIVDELRRERWFPRPWEPAQPGEPVHEGGTIERRGRWRYVYHWQRHHPISPTTLAEQGQRVFLTAAGAARHYLRWDLNLPGRLDAHEVID